MELNKTIQPKLITALTSVILIIFFISGCTKDEDGPEDPGTGTTTTTGSVPASEFKWSVNTSTASVIADSAFCYAQFTTLYAYKSGTVNTVEINVSDIVPGTYNISSVTGNELKYVTGGTTFNATSGSVKILTNSGGKLSGNFSCGFGSSSPSSIAGSFQEVRIR
jgi:hypothetical protein